MRTFAKALLLAALIGCGSDGGINPPTEPLPSAAASPIGYGLPNYWHQTDPHAFAAQLAKAGLNLTIIEMIPWFTQEGKGCKLNGGLKDQFFPEEAEEFVDAMRAYGITTIIFGVNANHCAARKWPIERFEALNSFVLRIGIDHVWYLPINEPWAMDHGTGSRWTGSARRSWDGVFLIADRGRNHATGHPFFGVPRDLTTVNACSQEAAHKSLTSGLGTLTTTDCGQMLHPSPGWVGELARLSLDHAAPLVVYDFDGREPDQAVIAAMGAEVSRASGNRD